MTDDDQFMFDNDHLMLHNELCVFGDEQPLLIIFMDAFHCVLMFSLGFGFRKYIWFGCVNVKSSYVSFCMGKGMLCKVLIHLSFVELRLFLESNKCCQYMLFFLWPSGQYFH